MPLFLLAQKKRQKKRAPRLYYSSLRRPALPLRSTRGVAFGLRSSLGQAGVFRNAKTYTNDFWGLGKLLSALAAS